VHVTNPPEGAPQLHTAFTGAEIDENVVFAGTLILKVEDPEFDGPEFVTVLVIANAPPVVGTGSGVPVIVTPRFVAACTVAVAVAVLFALTGSEPELGTEIESVNTVPPATVVPTSAVTSIVAAAVTARLDPVHVTTFEALTQFQPAGAVAVWKVVPVGSVSVNVTTPEAFGPLLVTVCENTTLFPAKT
jgi:hypothetical protein